MNGILIRERSVCVLREQTAECGMEKKCLRHCFLVVSFLENEIYYAAINQGRKYRIRASFMERMKSSIYKY